MGLEKTFYISCDWCHVVLGDERREVTGPALVIVMRAQNEGWHWYSTGKADSFKCPRCIEKAVGITEKAMSASAEKTGLRQFDAPFREPYACPSCGSQKPMFAKLLAMDGVNENGCHCGECD